MIKICIFIEWHSAVKTNLLKVPSMALIPIPSTISLVNLNGTVSGVANTRPFSKAIPNVKIKKMRMRIKIENTHNITGLLKK